MLSCLSILVILSVPGSESRDHDVILGGAQLILGKPPGGREFGMGRDWGGFEEGEVSSRATRGQGGQDCTTQREGFQVSKRESEKNQQGEQKGGFVPICTVNLCRQSVYVYIIIVRM
jgi:hypothetical protein